MTGRLAPPDGDDYTYASPFHPRPVGPPWPDEAEARIAALERESQDAKIRLDDAEKGIQKQRGHVGNLAQHRHIHERAIVEAQSNIQGLQRESQEHAEAIATADFNLRALLARVAVLEKGRQPRAPDLDPAVLAHRLINGTLGEELAIPEGDEADPDQSGSY